MSAGEADSLQSNNDTNNKLPPVVGRLERGEEMPVCVIVVGMAGSGKTTLMTQLQRNLDARLDNDDNAVADDDDDDSNPTAASTTAPTTADEEEHRTDHNEEEGDTTKVPSAASDAAPSTDDEEDDGDDDVRSYYCVNLDPATISMPYEVSIDIRDTVDYKQVMKQHKLGPNGAIMTSLNLFATKFDQVMTILERRAYGGTEPSNQDKKRSSSRMEYILVDTPGQIEAFTWSASGSIMSESLASAFPTVLCFVVDTVRCASSPNTFMSNMLYAASMLYRTRLPLVVCFNKIDVVSHEFCVEWMRDYESFQQALDDVSESSGFYGSLTRSLSLVLDEFYSNFAHACGVSAVTGAGVDDFWATVQKAARQDFATDYVDDLKCRIEEIEAKRRAKARSSFRRFQRDANADAENKNNAGADAE